MNLWLLGDPIYDLYHYGTYKNETRFVVEEVVGKPGGAWNTLENLRALVKNSNVKVRIGYFHAILEDRDEIIELRRIQSRSGDLIEYWPYPPEIDMTAVYSEKPLIDWGPSDVPKGVVISDYNKGMVNTNRKLSKWPPPEADYVIADSRYRTLNLDLIDNCKVKIWHATGYEWDYEWAQNFDYTIRTNGPDPIEIYRKGTLAAPILRVPDTPVTDVTGAGDTFTAAVGAYLTKCYDDISIETLTAASKFAIDCCQEVIQVPYCAVTSRSI